MAQKFLTDVSIKDSSNLFVDGKLKVGDLTAATNILHVASGTADTVARFTSGDGLAKIIVEDNDTQAFVGASDNIAFYGPASGASSYENIRLDNRAGRGNGGYGAYGQTPNEAYKFRVNAGTLNTSTDANYAGFSVDIGATGTASLSADRYLRGLYIDVDSDATGGDTSNELRIYGGEFNVKDTGDADLLYGLYVFAENEKTSALDQVTTVAGVRAQTNIDNTAGTVQTSHGVYGTVRAAGSGTKTNMYAGRFEVSTGTSDADISNVYGSYGKVSTGTGYTGTIATARGAYGEVEIATGNTYTNSWAVQAVVDHNGGTATTAAQFRGSTSGTIGTSYGIYSTGAAINRIDGTIKLGNAGVGGADATSVTGLSIKSQSVSSQQSAIDIIQNGSGTNSIIRMGEKSTDGARLHMFDGGVEKIAFYTDGTANHISAGNLGVGTNNPNERLHVGGTGRFDGDLHFSGGVSGLVYRPVESNSAVDRYFVMFDYTNNASYPFLTNRTPNGAVVIKTGTAAAGGENEHFRIKGGDGTVDAYFTNTNLGIGTSSPDHLLHVEFANTDTSFSGGGGGAWGSEGIRIENTSGTAGTMAMLHFRNNDADIHIAGIRRGTDDSDLGFFFEGTEKVLFENDGSATFAGQASAKGLRVKTRGTASAETWNTSDGDGIFFDFYNDGNPYLRHGSIIANSGDASAAQLEFYTTPASGSGTLALTLDSSQNATFAGKIVLPDNKAAEWPGGSIRAEGNTLKLVATTLIDLQDNTQIQGTLSSGDITISKSVGDSVLTIEADTDNNNENDNPRIELKQDGGAVYSYYGLNGDLNNTFTGAQVNYTYLRASTGLQLITNGSTTALTIDTSQNATFAGDITVQGGQIYINDTNTKLEEGTGNAFRVTTDSGYIDIGPKNTGHCHIETNRTNFYFNKELRVNTGIITSYDEDLSLQRASSADGSVNLNIGMLYSTTKNDSQVQLGGFTLNTALEDTYHVYMPGVSPNTFAGAHRKLTVTATKNGTSISAASLANAFLAHEETVSIQTSNTDTIIIEVSGWGNNYGQWYGITFGSAQWRAKDIDIEISSDNGANYTSIYSENNQPHATVRTYHGGSSTLINKIKYTLTNWNTTSTRINHIFGYKYLTGDTNYLDKYRDETMYSSLNFRDNYAATFGNSGDLVIKHNGNSIIETHATDSVGDLYIKSQGTNHDLYLQAADDILIQPQGSENGIRVHGNDNVELYFNNVRKLRTTNTGINVEGEVVATTLDISGNIQFSDGYLFANSVTSSSTTTTVASVSSSTYTAVFFDYSIKNGTNVRAGTIVATHDGTNVEFNETSTVDLGDTSDVTLNVDLVSSNLSLKATTTSSTWTVKSLVRAI